MRSNVLLVNSDEQSRKVNWTDASHDASRRFYWTQSERKWCAAPFRKAGCALLIQKTALLPSTPPEFTRRLFFTASLTLSSHLFAGVWNGQNSQIIWIKVFSLGLKKYSQNYPNPRNWVPLINIPFYKILIKYPCLISLPEHPKKYQRYL